MEDDTRLFVVYRRVEPYLYGAISVVGAEALAQGGTIPLEWSYPYVVSKQLEGREIVYGSLFHLIGEAAKPIFRMNYRVGVLAESLPEDVQSSVRVRRTANALIHESPSSKFPDWFLNQQEELTKEGILQSGLHLRTLLEVLSGKRNAFVPVYDYEGHSNGAVTLTELFHMLMHHRYCVISGEYMHDIFSDRDQLDSPRLLGSKVKSAELLNAVLSYLTGVTVNDFVGVLRGRLKSLAVDSEPRDIIFAVQNVHVLAEIIGDRITDKRFPKLQELLFKEFTADERCQIEIARRQSNTIRLVRRFGKPAFAIDPALRERRIQMSINVNGNSESFKFDQDQFFEVLTTVFGDDPLVPMDKLLEQYDKAAVVTSPEVSVLDVKS